MSHLVTEKLVIAVSSRALFNLDESHAIFEHAGVDAYCRHQIENEDVPLKPGVAFNLVKKLLALNAIDPAHPRVEVILLSRNTADTGLRIFNSIQHHQLDIGRAAFTGGASTHQYISAFGAHLFLSAYPDDVRKALEAGFAAATIMSSAAPDMTDATHPSQLRIAFDGDAVLFSDESERIYKQNGLDAFQTNEVKAAKQPLPGGPFKNFLAMLHQIQLDYPENASPIRSMFKKGDFIEHPKREWGYGLVTEDQQGNQLKVNFPSVGLKTISLEHIAVKRAEFTLEIKNNLVDSIIKNRIYIDEPFSEIYQDLKIKFSNHLIIIENGIYYEVLFKDAELMSGLYGWKVYERSHGQPITGFKDDMTYIFRDLRNKNIPYVLVSQVTHKSRDKIERNVSEIFHGLKN